MDKKLFAQAIAKFLCGVLLVGVLIFAPAGTLHFASGWLLMGILFVPMFAAGLVMLKKNPKLLEKRLQVKEKEKTPRENTGRSLKKLICLSSCRACVPGS